MSHPALREATRRIHGQSAVSVRSGKVATALAKEGVQVEVIDLRTLSPLDIDTVLESVEKTGRLLIAHEDTLFMGFGAEIAAVVAYERDSL